MAPQELADPPAHRIARLPQAGQLVRQRDRSLRAQTRAHRKSCSNCARQQSDRRRMGLNRSRMRPNSAELARGHLLRHAQVACPANQGEVGRQTGDPRNGPSAGSIPTAGTMMTLRSPHCTNTESPLACSLCSMRFAQPVVLVEPARHVRRADEPLRRRDPTCLAHLRHRTELRRPPSMRTASTRRRAPSCLRQPHRHVRSLLR